MTPPTLHPPPLKILVVDDEEGARISLKAMLHFHGHMVSMASSGIAALELFEAERWDLVVTDGNMPGMDGRQLAREIRKISPRTPVILVSGLSMWALDAVFAAVLTKPFTYAELAAAMIAGLAAGIPLGDAAHPP